MALMHRQSLVKFDAPLCETIVDTPKPQGSEVLVRIERCGLCHSDLHIQDGYADLGGGKQLDTTRGMTLPFTLGHEIAGVVEEVGPDAPKDLIGKKKAVFPWIGCGKCRDCLAGDENLCARNRFLGVSIDGGFASHVLVPDAKYLLDYDPLPVDQAATLMCSGITAYGALKRLVDRPRQRNILLIGLGGVGMMGLSLAQAMFKQPISVADLSPAARESRAEERRSRRLRPAGAGTRPAHHQGNRRRLRRVVDFAGNDKSMAFAVSAVARGGKIVVSGLMGGNFSLPMVQWIYKRMTIEGFMVGTLAEAQGTDGARPRRQGEADADAGKADGRDPEVDRANCAPARSSAASCWRTDGFGRRFPHCRPAPATPRRAQIKPCRPPDLRLIATQVFDEIGMMTRCVTLPEGQMSRRTAKFVSALFASLFAGTPLVTVSHGATEAADSCLSGRRHGPQGRHWYYRVDRATKRNCWYLGVQGEKIARAAAENPALLVRPDPPLAAPSKNADTDKSIANARAEWPFPQTRIEQAPSSLAPAADTGRARCRRRSTSAPTPETPAINDRLSPRAGLIPRTWLRRLLRRRRRRIPQLGRFNLRKPRRRLRLPQ